MIQKWDAIHAASEAAYAMRKLAVALRALAEVDQSSADHARQHASEADGAAGVIDSWRRAIQDKIPAN